jgi:hypothetical protein
MNSSSNISPKTPLLEGENILWQSRSGELVPGEYKMSFGARLALLAVLLFVTLTSLWPYWSAEKEISNDLIIWTFIWLVIAVISFFYLIKSFFPSNDPSKKKCYEHYFITNRRLIIERETGSLRHSYFDRPFNYIGISARRAATNITLAMALDSEPDDTEIWVELVAIENPALAEKLLTENFMRGKNNE